MPFVLQTLFSQCHITMNVGEADWSTYRNENEGRDMSPSKQ